MVKIIKTYLNLYFNKEVQVKLENVLGIKSMYMTCNFQTIRSLGYTNSLKTLKERDETYLFGDFNINMANSNEATTKDFNWLLHSLNMVQHIKSSTRVAESSRTILDLIIPTKCDKIQDVSTVLSTISDHYPVYINIKKSKTNIKKLKVKGRNYKNFSSENYNTLLQNMDWENVTGEDNPEKSWEALEEILMTALDKVAPIREMKVSQTPPPWMDQESREFIRRKNIALKQAHKSGKKEDWIEAKAQRNKVNQQIKRKKRQYIGREARSKNPKKIWSAIWKLIPSENQHNKIYSIKHQDKRFTDPVQLRIFSQTTLQMLGKT